MSGSDDEKQYNSEDLVSSLGESSAEYDSEDCISSAKPSPESESEEDEEDDSPSSERKRMERRLKLYSLVERRIHGDGNCQFRSISDQLYNTEDQHQYVRQKVVKQLRKYEHLYKDHVTMPYENYVDNMSNAGEWGDHITLQAAADKFKVRILVITSFKKPATIEIDPNNAEPTKGIYLSYWADLHYNSAHSQQGGTSGSSHNWSDSNENKNENEDEVEVEVEEEEEDEDEDEEENEDEDE